MPEPTQLDRTHHFVLERFVERGYGPHYTEIAKAFGVPPEEGRKLLHDLLGTGLPLWVHPRTDLIVSVAPFSSLPTQYQVTVDGRRGWFGQCGFESLARCWVFPGKSVHIDSPCLDCGEPMRVVVRDGVIEGREPEGIVGYADVPFRDWSKDWPFT